MSLFFAPFATPFGEMTVYVDAKGALVELTFPLREVKKGFARDDSHCKPIVQELLEYFNGRRKEFTMELAPEGTEFQKIVWAELSRIPYGQTISYGELARRIGRPTASRAVGAANGRNPIPIVVPCHRVIGTSGTLTGYAGGLEIKRGLLEIEGIEVHRRGSNQLVFASIAE